MNSIMIPFSAACERNKEVIGDTIAPYLQTLDSVLEIGSGTGQHAVYLASQFPHLQWQTSDQQEYLEGISAQLNQAHVDNLLPPLQLEVGQTDWAAGNRYSAIYSANTLHIMAWEKVQALFAGLSAVSNPRAYLIIYGPFKYAGRFTSESNRTFDASLRSRGCGSAIRDFEEVDALAQQADFLLLQDHAMPANNQCLVWQRSK